MRREFLKRRERTMFSMRILRESVILLDALAEVTKMTKTELMELALWQAFDQKLICTPAQHKKIAKDIEPKLSREG